MIVVKNGLRVSIASTTIVQRKCSRKRRAERIDIVSLTTMKTKVKTRSKSVALVPNSNGTLRTKAQRKCFGELSQMSECIEAVVADETLVPEDHAMGKYFGGISNETSIRSLQSLIDAAANTWIVYCDSLDDFADVERTRAMGNLVLDDAIIGNGQRIVKNCDLQTLMKRINRAAILEKEMDVYYHCDANRNSESHTGIWSIDCSILLLWTLDSWTFCNINFRLIIMIQP